MFLVRRITLCLCLLLPQFAFAKSDLESRREQIIQPEMVFASYVQGSYNYLVRSPYFVSDDFNRVNDIAKNGVRLQQVFLLASYLQEGLGGYAEVLVGQDAYYLADSGWNADVFNLQTIGLVVPETYLQYRHQSFALKAGFLSALAGLESHISTRDTNFSRSILYGDAQPGSHVSLRAIQHLSDSFSVIMGLCNGWSTVRHPGQLNALELGVTVDLAESFTLTVDGFLTPAYLSDATQSGPEGVRRLFDVYGTYQVTKPLSIAWNLDVGTQSKASLPGNTMGGATWAGMSGYVNYQFSDRWRTSVRGEIFNDSDGYRTGIRQSLKEMTLTLGYSPIQHLEMMVEARHDFSNVDSFIDQNGRNRNNNQQSFALEALYQFV